VTEPAGAMVSARRPATNTGVLSVACARSVAGVVRSSGKGARQRPHTADLDRVGCVETVLRLPPRNVGTVQIGPDSVRAPVRYRDNVYVFQKH